MTMQAPETIETPRLVLRRPLPIDVEAIFARYASDPEVTRFMSWPAHRSLADTRAFLAFSEAEWSRWPAGPYLVRSRADGALLGSTGLAFETPHRAQTGYVLARDAWGRGYATEALRAIVEVARTVGVGRLYAICHTEHRPSWRVLEKCGLAREGTLQRYANFPNLSPGEPCDVYRYVMVFAAGRTGGGFTRCP
jgi:ribosomal-protein-alanine N-acetyltransferase